jgi:hypothetical protein
VQYLFSYRGWVFNSSAYGAKSIEQDAAKRQDIKAAEVVENLDKPLYSPFVERYVLDELRNVRADLAAQRVELVQMVVDRELNSVDRGVTYATNTVTYFFYLIAGVSTIMVLVGWTSIREIKDRVETLADEKVSKLVAEYEHRLRSIETQLNQKSLSIEENREEIALTQELQSLWLRAGQENLPANKIPIYDQILKLRGDDCEALSYKADACLEVGEPQWAANLCHQALAIDADNTHAFYQLACAYTVLEKYEEAGHYLKRALQGTEDYKEAALNDPALASLRERPGFNELFADNFLAEKK